MTLQYSDEVRNQRLDTVETVIGAAPILELRSGSAPATCATADSGTLVCSITLPSDWLAAASSGVKAKAGTWSGTGSVAAGGGTNVGHFRIKNAGSPNTTGMQGTVTATGGGGDLTLDNISVATSQAVTITSFQITGGNA